MSKVVDTGTGPYKAQVGAEPAPVPETDVEWVNASCASCGCDDVPCQLDGVVFTCVHCLPTRPA